MRGSLLGFLAGTAFGAAAFAWAERRAPLPLVADPPPEVLRRLEIRLHDLDRTHPSAGGERYRRFECREVPRGG